MILTPDSIRTETIGGKEIRIKEKIIPDSARSVKDQASWCMKGGKVKPCKPIGINGTPRGVCIHNTSDIKTAANTDPAEQYTRATWPNCNMGGAAVHYYVYDSSIWQNLRENESGWHAGDGSYRRVLKHPGWDICGNLDTVAIECIGDRPGSEETTAYLAAYLLKKYGLCVEKDLYAHHDFSKKYCPAYILPHWDAFCRKVQSILDSDLALSPAPASTEKQTTRDFKLGDTVRFTGGYSYKSSMDANPAGEKRPACTARLTLHVREALHPWHAVACDNSGAVYGWVDEKDLLPLESAPIPTPAPEKKAEAPKKEFKLGDTVHFTGGYSYKSSVAKTPAGKKRPACTAVLTLYAKGAPHPWHAVASDNSGAVYGWVDEKNLEK